jgi:cobalamin biosynthesis Mg chelatase CobN
MQCYALGALELFDDIYDIDSRMTIYQPRRQNVSTYEISKDELYRWADEVLKPTAELAFAGDGNFLCGEWCGFCKAKNDCRARAEANLKLAQHEFKLPPLLTDRRSRSSSPRWTSWSAGRPTSRNTRSSRRSAVRSGTASSSSKAAPTAGTQTKPPSPVRSNAGFDPYEQKLLGITAMQKLLGKSRFDELLRLTSKSRRANPRSCRRATSVRR